VKIFRLLPLFFLGVLFVLVLPHFHDKAFADTETDYCQTAISTSGHSNWNNIIGAPDGLVGNINYTQNAVFVSDCIPTTNHIATSSAINSIEFHDLATWNSTGYFFQNLEDVHSVTLCSGQTQSYPAGTTLVDHVFTITC